MRFVYLLISLFSIVPAMGWAQASMTGDWVAHYHLRDADGWERMHLTQDGKTITGVAGDHKVSGTLDGAALTLAEKKEKGDVFAITATIQDGEIVGHAHNDGEDVEFRAAREKTGPATPSTHTFEPKVFHRLFSGSIEPVMHIFPGDTVKTWTVDAGGGDSHGKKLSNGGNPETGPFYVEGALPGDQLVVKLNRVRLNRDNAFSGDRVTGGALNPWYFAGQEKVKDFDTEWLLDREHGVARLKKPTEKLKDFTIPLRPMMGCIAVAPGGNMVLRSGFLGAYGGNMDYNEMREGVTLYLPVNRPGALLFIGDGHAAQGDGELTGDALETSMDVEFTVNVVRGGAKGQGGPRLENDDYIMAMGIAGSLNEALQSATTEMSKWLSKDFGLNTSEVAMVLGSSMRYDIAEVVDPYVNIVAKVNKKALGGLKKK